MHEERLLRELHRKLAELAPVGGPVRVTAVRLRVGALAHVPESTLRSRWPEVTEGTRAGASRLEITTASEITDPNSAGILLVSVDVDDGSEGAHREPDESSEGAARKGS